MHKTRFRTNDPSHHTITFNAFQSFHTVKSLWRNIYLRIKTTKCHSLYYKQIKYIYIVQQVLLNLLVVNSRLDNGWFQLINLAL